jgi:predicted Ser/Thr protein kinase
MALEAPTRTIRCPDCGQELSLPADQLDRERPCPKCGRSLLPSALALQPTPLPDLDTQARTVDLAPAAATKPRAEPVAQADSVREAPGAAAQADSLRYKDDTPKTPPTSPQTGFTRLEDLVGKNAAPPPDPLLDTVLGKVLLKRVLGEGGMGTVYLGRHLTLDIDVAVKVLPPNLAQRNQAFIERFLREARTAAQIHHPNIVQVFDVDFQRGYFFIVMEYVEGETAAERLRRKGRLSEREVVELGLEAAAALEYARRKAIVHRDVKPENLLISRDGEVKLADLGLAKRVAGETGSGLTLDGQALGTPAYIAPEQVSDARAADHRSDLYALGASLFFLATGRPPFQGPTAFQTMMRHLNEAAPELRAYRAELSVELNAIVKRLLQKDPRARYQTAGELGLELRALYERLVPLDERNAALTSAPDSALAPGGSARNLQVASFWRPATAPLARGETPAAASAPAPAGVSTSATTSFAPLGEAPLPAGVAPAAPAPPRAADGYRILRPSRLWLFILFLPFLNWLALLWVGAVARKRLWFYSGLGLLLGSSAFTYLEKEGGWIARAGYALIYLATILYGLLIRREYEFRALDVARERGDEEGETPGKAKSGTP